MKKISLFFKHWPVYIIGIIISSFLVCTCISIKCKPKQEEKIMVFAASGTINVSNFIKESLSVTDEYIREIEVRHGYSKEDSTSFIFGSVYADCDFYIFPESWVDRIKPLALNFTNDQIHENIPNSVNMTFLKDGESNFGLQIYDKESKNGYMKSLISFEEEKDIENYYILFRRTSYHIGDFNRSPSKNALKVVNNLLSL